MCLPSDSDYLHPHAGQSYQCNWWAKPSPFTRYDWCNDDDAQPCHSHILDQLKQFHPRGGRLCLSLKHFLEVSERMRFTRCFTLNLVVVSWLLIELHRDVFLDLWAWPERVSYTPRLVYVVEYARLTVNIPLGQRRTIGHFFKVWSLFCALPVLSSDLRQVELLVWQSIVL